MAWSIVMAFAGNNTENAPNALLTSRMSIKLYFLVGYMSTNTYISACFLRQAIYIIYVFTITKTPLIISQLYLLNISICIHK
jgi:hypothetical protein